MTESIDATRPVLSVNVADRPAQTVPDAEITNGLNVAEASDLTVRPDRDALVVKNDDGSFFVLDIPSDAVLTGLRPGARVSVVHPDTGAALQGGIFRYTDNPGLSERYPALAADVAIGGKKSPAEMRRIGSPEEALPLASPFTDTLVVESDGALYEITLNNEFEDLAAGQAVDVTYVPLGAREPVRFSGIVASFDDTAKKENYAFSGPVRFAMVNADGSAIDPGSPAYDEFAAALEKESPLRQGEKYSRNEMRRRLKRLAKALENDAFLVTPNLAWAESGVSVSVSLTVVAPIGACRLKLVPSSDTPPEWIATRTDATSVDRLGRTLNGILQDSVPLSAAAWKKAQIEIRQYSRKNTDWDVDPHIGLSPEGGALVICVVTPEAKGFAAVIDGNAVTSEDVETPWHLPESVPVSRLKTHGGDFFAALSRRYAERGEVLVSTREGQVEPVIPEYSKVGGTWQLTAHGGDSLLTAKMPRFVRFDPPTDADGKPRGPRPDEWLAMFSDPDFPGLYTTAAIAAGLKNLTRWYDERGYRLVGGHLNCEIGGDGNLHVRAELYRLAKDITLIPEGSDIPEAKLEKHLKYIEREFRFRAGQFLNARDLGDAIAAVGARFHIIAKPFVETDDAAGTAKVTVQLIDDGVVGLDKLTIGGGYSGTNGAFVQASESFTSYNGFRNSASLSYFPQADLAGAGASLSTPRDENGGTHEASLSGQYYLDYVSSVGANYNYLFPIGDSRFSLIAGAGAQAMFSEGQAVDGTDALYFGPNFGVAYAGNGLSARLVAGPRVSTQGAFYLGIEGGVSKRYDLNEAETLYLELYAKGGALVGIVGDVPAAARFHNAPIALHGYYVQPPIEAKLYAVAGANLMQELPGGILDVGIGASAGVIGGVWTVGGGIKIRLKVFFPVTVTIGPALVNGVPTPVTVSLGP